MRVATYNANSIRARFSTLQSWLNRRQPDILCVQETKVQDVDFPLEALKSHGYDAAFTGQKSYNGVAILSKSPITHLHQGLYQGGQEEARFLSGTILGIPVINVYVPQGVAPGTEKFAYKLRWLEDLFLFVKDRFEPSRPLLLAGDFNVALEPIDVFDPEGLRGQVGFHPDEQRILRRFLDWGLIDVFRKHRPEAGHYTFWDYRIPNAFKRKMGWRIDYILATPPLAEKSTDSWVDTAERLAQRPSDHTFLVAEFRLEG